MKKKIISLSVVTIVFGSVYLINNEFNLFGNQTLTEEVPIKIQSEITENNDKKGIQESKNKIKKSIDNRLKSIEINNTVNYEKNKFLEFEEETNLNQEVENWFVEFKYSDYFEDGYVKLSTEYLEEKIDDNNFNKVLETPIKNYYSHFNGGANYAVVNYAYFKYLEPNDFKIVWNEIKKEGVKYIKGFDFYFLKEKGNLKKFTATYCSYPTICDDQNNEYSISIVYRDNGTITGTITNKSFLKNYFIINEDGYLFIYNKLDENGEERFGLQDPKLMRNLM